MILNDDSPPYTPPRLVSPPPFVKSSNLFDIAKNVVTGKRRTMLGAGMMCYLLAVWWYFSPPHHGGRGHFGPWRMHEGGILPGEMGGAQAAGGGRSWRGSWPAGPGKPLTVLGLKADEVYKLGSLNAKVYQEELEAFIRQHFPPADWNEEDPDSLVNAMRSYFIPEAEGKDKREPKIPSTLFQTAATRAEYERNGASTMSFQYFHPSLNVTFHDNEAADDWVSGRFYLPGIEKGDRGITVAWEKLASPQILRSDLWRYLVLAVDGGVYVDTDCEAIRPFPEWSLDPSWDGKQPLDFTWPSLLVGIEADVGFRQDWQQWWPRPLQVAQWTIASARGHPVLIDTLRRLVEMALTPPTNVQRLSVMERTGPGPFTDALLRYVRVQWGVTWADLRGLGDAGWRFHDAAKSIWGDTKILPITGFSPGIGHMGSKEANSPAAMVRHNFLGSWRTQPGAVP